MQSGQRVDLEELELAGGVTAEVDARRVPAIQCLHRGQRQAGGFVRQGLIGDQPVLDAVEVFVLVELRVGAGLGALGPHHFHDRDDTRTDSVADDPDRDLSSGEELFDEKACRKVRQQPGTSL